MQILTSDGINFACPRAFTADIATTSENQ